MYSSSYYDYMSIGYNNKYDYSPLSNAVQWTDLLEILSQHVSYHFAQANGGITKRTKI